MLNVVCTSGYQVYVRKLVSKDEKDQMGPFGFSFINGTLSLPLFLVFGLAMNEQVLISKVMDAPPLKITALVASGFVAFVLSVSAFALNIRISATAMAVINNVNKFAVIALSEVFIEATLGPVSLFGTLLVMFSGYMYASSERVSKWLRSLTEIPTPAAE